MYIYLSTARPTLVKDAGRLQCHINCFMQARTTANTDDKRRGQEVVIAFACVTTLLADRMLLCASLRYPQCTSECDAAGMVPVRAAIAALAGTLRAWPQQQLAWIEARKGLDCELFRI